MRGITGRRAVSAGCWPHLHQLSIEHPHAPFDLPRGDYAPPGYSSYRLAPACCASATDGSPANQKQGRNTWTLFTWWQVGTPISTASAAGGDFGKLIYYIFRCTSRNPCFTPPLCACHTIQHHTHNRAPATHLAPARQGPLTNVQPAITYHTKAAQTRSEAPRSTDTHRRTLPSILNSRSRPWVPMRQASRSRTA